MGTIVATDEREPIVDGWGGIIEELVDDVEFVCSMEFAEAEAFAEALEAGRHRGMAARFMHRWALTEPEWDAEHGDVVRRWLAIDCAAGSASHTV